MFPLTEGVVIAALGMLTTGFASFVGWYKLSIERQKVDQAQLEMRFQRAALSFPEFVEEWTDIQQALLDLMENTSVDRFLILRAWNGHLEPRWTTAMYQMRTGMQVPVAYIHFELDKDYVNMLREITHGHIAVIRTADLPSDSILREVYDLEKITSAVVAQIVTLEGPVKGTKAQTYCSFATHSTDGMSPEDIVACKVLVGRLKGLSEAFELKTTRG
jgi:hypothetical protein